MLKLDVGIAGAGIGGLSAAVALTGLGHAVTVYEAATELREIGAGIQITPNASRHLLAWGLGDHLPDLNRTMSSFKVRRWNDGKIIGLLDTENYRAQFNAPYVQVHRADLQQALRKVAEVNGAKIITRSAVVDYDLDAPAMVLKDGQIIRKDLILAADGTIESTTFAFSSNKIAGIRSVARKNLSKDTEAPLISTGLAVYRATVSSEYIVDEPDLSHVINNPGLNLWLGPGMHVVVYSMRGNQLVNLLLECHESRPPSEWSDSTYIDELREHISSWDPSLGRLFANVNSAIKLPLRFTTPSEHWTSDSGRFLLMGDASYAVPSFLAQGAAMAIEDAATLSDLLSSIRSKDDLPSTLSDFEAIRRPRKEGVEQLSLHNLRLYHLDDEMARQTRDNPSCANPDDLPIWNSLRDQQWLYGY